MDTAIAERVMNLPEWSDAAVVLVYRSMQDEISTALLVERALASGKLVGYPRISGEVVRFHRFDGDAALLSRHRYGMEEPVEKAETFDPAHLAAAGSRVLLIVPGLAFDRRGSRLGRGGGFYDRFLTAHRQDLHSAGLCYEQQLLPKLPVEAHDSPVDLVVTEGGTYRTDLQERSQRSLS